MPILKRYKTYQIIAKANTCTDADGNVSYLGRDAGHAAHQCLLRPLRLPSCNKIRSAHAHSEKIQDVPDHRQGSAEETSSNPLQRGAHRKCSQG
jgi:hypothetical protein